VDIGLNLGVYTWFPYQISDRFTDVNNIIVLVSWVISTQGHFTKNTDLFPRKLINSLHGCRMKAIVRNGQRYFTTNYASYKDTNGKVWWNIESLEMELLRIIWRQLNMTFFFVPTPRGFERGKVGNLT
jgi:hypothetical protein